MNQTEEPAKYPPEYIGEYFTKLRDDGTLKRDVIYFIAQVLHEFGFVDDQQTQNFAADIFMQLITTKSITDKRSYINDHIEDFLNNDMHSRIIYEGFDERFSASIEQEILSLLGVNDNPSNNQLSIYYCGETEGVITYSNSRSTRGNNAVIADKFWRILNIPTLHVKASTYISNIASQYQKNGNPKYIVLGKNLNNILCQGYVEMREVKQYFKTHFNCAKEKVVMLHEAQPENFDVEVTKRLHFNTYQPLIKPHVDEMYLRKIVIDCLLKRYVSTPEVASILYDIATQVAKECGYTKVDIYIQPDEVHGYVQPVSVFTRK